MHAWLGSTALLALLFSALASLLTHGSHTATRAKLLRLRRALGLFAFAAVVLHAAGSLTHLHATSFTALWNRVSALRYVEHGALAALVLLVLTLTSFPKLNARLGLRMWAPLHRLAYAAPVLAALHALQAPHMSPRNAAAALAVALAIVVVRVLAVFRRKRPEDSISA